MVEIEERRVPRELRTPITEADSALNTAREFWIELIGGWMANNPERNYGELANPESYFDSKIFGKTWDDPATNGDKLVDEIGLSLDGKRDPENAPFALLQIMYTVVSDAFHGIGDGGKLQIMYTVVSYAVQEIKAEKGDKHDEAWTYAVDASYWAGILLALWAQKKDGKNPAIELAKKRHAENYALIEDALKYWREKIDPTISASKAADELVRVVPLSHKKLAEIVAAEKKKQP